MQASTSEPLLRTLAPALRELETRLHDWLKQPHRFPLSALQKANLEGLSGDLARQAKELQVEQPLLVIMLMGGTGVGKSTLLNALAGGTIAQASFARPTTRDPVVYYHESIQPSRLDPALQHCKLAAHDRPTLVQKILVDTPDLDSNDLANREKLHRLLPVADVVLYVGSQEKYHDKLGWDLFLKQRQRRAFAFILNKWDRCLQPGASGIRPDEDLLRDLESEGFRGPLIFRTCAQHWVDNPWQANGRLQAPVEGEQFGDLVCWLEQGLNRLEIEAIKARGVGQLLRHLHKGVEAACPPDLRDAVETIQSSWATILSEEAHTIATVLLNILEPFQKEIEHHFAVERQGKFRNIMGTYLHYFNRLKYAGSTLRNHIRFLPNLGNSVELPKEWDIDSFTQACMAAAAEQHLDARARALANRLLVAADAKGFPLNLLSSRTEAASKVDWRSRHAQAMIEVLGQVESEWTKPAGVRRYLQASLVFLADWLPPIACGGMVVLLLWGYIMERAPFAWGDLLKPFVVTLLVIVILHVLIAVFLPLRWMAIRGEFERGLEGRLRRELEHGFSRIPDDEAQELMSERREVEQFLAEIREVSAWLESQEQAASIANLYGKT